MGFTELLWLKKLLIDMIIEVKEPIKIYYDNKTTISLPNNFIW